MSATSEFVAVVPVRASSLPAGAAEAVAEAGGSVVLVGDGLEAAAETLQGIASDVRLVAAEAFAPGSWSAHLAPLVAGHRVVVLPASPDGRDLAPRLAAEMDRPLFASALRIDADQVATASFGGRAVSHYPLTGPAVVTLQPGARSVEPDVAVVAAVGQLAGIPGVAAERSALANEGEGEAGESPASEATSATAHIHDAVVESVLPPDIATMDLSESPRLLGGGAGLDSAERFEQLRRVAADLDASMGATRVITDRGWLGHNRQIGTTGVVVDPDLYIAFGISGAVQHTAGLGHPEHVISVNTDEHCPMMELADLAIVADANETLDQLERLLSSRADVVGGSTGTGES